MMPEVKIANFEELLHKYARVLLVKGNNLDKGQPLIVEIEKNMMFFADILKEEALKIGVTDIYFRVRDLDKELKLYSINDVEEFASNEEVLNVFDRSIVEKYYEKGGAIMYLHSRSPLALEKVPTFLQDKAYEIMDKTNEKAEKARRIYEFPWLIARLADKKWADMVFPNDEDSLTKMWDAVFKCMNIYDEDPIKSWNEKINRNNKRAQLLTDLKLTKLVYKNSLGTNLTLGLPKNHVWLSSGKKMPNKDKLIVCNMPTEEIFTSPDYRKTEGVVYSSKPLVLNNKIVNDLCLKFHEGKVVDVKASSNVEEIKWLIGKENANMLGEVALVDYDSPISNMDILFYTTLYDENASCHLALGTAFPITIQNGKNMNKEELLEAGLNVSPEHVDFMIGTSDLEIIGFDENGNEYQVFKDGNFVLNDNPKVLEKTIM